MPDQTITVLTEEALSDWDAARLLQVHDGDEAGGIDYHVLVPADVRRNLLADVLDHLSLLELREALDAARGQDDAPDRLEADAALQASLAALKGRGATADGQVITGDPLDAVRRDVTGGATELFVVTQPHAVEDTFHRDWASRARESLGVPVLHFYAGTNYLG